jgi:simple sugar transport system substrate-binding protein
MTMQSNSRRAAIKTLGAAGALAALQPFNTFAQAKPVVVGVIYVGPKDDFGWNQAQAEAAAQIKKLSGVKVVEEEKVPETADVQKSMLAMIKQDKATMLFPTSFGYFDPHILKVAADNPTIRFAHCGGLWTEGKHPKNVASYFGYIDECQFLNGIVAATVSKSKKIGFVAAKPIPQVLRNINAFALGAKSVDPSITTRVVFTGEWSMPVKEAEATNGLIDQGVDVITCHVDGPKVVVETAEKRGAFTCGYHANQSKLAPKGYLTGAEWNWLTPYTQFVKAAQEGKPLNNFLRGGLKEGFVKMSPYGAAAPEKGRKAADAVKAQMMKGGYVIFKAGMKDNKGNVVVAKDSPQSELELEKMNYLIEGVVGAIPG